MKKIKKKIIYSIFFAFLMVILMQKSADANTINNIDMEVFINKSGNASITETWDAYLDSGTEGYRSFRKMEDRKIYDFSVVDDQGIQYQSVKGWRKNGPFQEKVYKCSIQKDEDETELCWGISKYGKRRYTLKYSIANLVTQYKDAQGIYFNFLNIDLPVENAIITIKSEIPFNYDNSKIWAFGNNGSINFKNNYIVMNSDGLLNEKQYMVGLIKFDNQLFNTSGNSQKTFDQVYKSAIASAYNLNLVVALIIALVCSLFPVWLLWFGARLSAISERRKSKYSGYSFEVGEKKLPIDIDIPYYRDLPCNNRLEWAYWVAYMYELIPEEKLNQGLIGAYLLKWIKQGKIIVHKTKDRFLNRKDQNYVIQFNENIQFDFQSEKKLFNILVEAAGENKILEAKEFKKYCKKHYNTIMSWITNVREVAEYDLKRRGYIFEIPITKKNYTPSSVYKIHESLKNEAIKLKGLRKFLLDFSKISNRNFQEVHIWDDYLIFAHLLGIADKVSKQFSKLNPQLSDNTEIDIYISSYAASNISLMGYRNAERYYMRSRTGYFGGSGSGSGSGGSSFSSGGSSAGGSSGGGFR